MSVSASESVGPGSRGLGRECGGGTSAGSSVGTIVGAIGYDNFFLLSGALSLVTIVFLPALARIRPRIEENE